MSEGRWTEGHDAPEDAVEAEPTGPRAAWRHLALAWLALWRPASAEMARRPGVLRLGPMQVYLVYNVALYGYVAVAYLSGIPHPRHSPGGSLAADVAWGTTSLVVVAAQVAALLVDRMRVWALSAGVTAAWATAQDCLLLFATVHMPAVFGVFLLWSWVVGIHFLFITHRLVPAREPDGHGGEEAAEAHAQAQAILDDATGGAA